MKIAHFLSSSPLFKPTPDLWSDEKKLPDSRFKETRYDICTTLMSKLWHRNSKTLILYSRIHNLEWSFFTIRSCISQKRKIVLGFKIFGSTFSSREALSELWQHFELLEHKCLLVFPSFEIIFLVLLLKSGDIPAW